MYTTSSSSPSLWLVYCFVWMGKRRHSKYLHNRWHGYTKISETMRVSLGFIDIHSQYIWGKTLPKNLSTDSWCSNIYNIKLYFFLMTQQHAMNPIYLLFRPKMWIQTKQLDLFVCSVFRKFMVKICTKCWISVLSLFILQSWCFFVRSNFSFQH